jgi:hypothetical protein
MVPPSGQMTDSPLGQTCVRTAIAEDGEVRLADGSRGSTTMFTIAEVEPLVAHWPHTGEYAHATSFCCSTASSSAGKVSAT